jgi:hypothetical protein
VLSSILYLGMLLPLLVAAGFMGGFVARQKAPRVEARIVPPWTAYERAREVENVGFLSGVSGGGLILSFLLVWWWLGHIEIRINF